MMLIENQVSYALHKVVLDASIIYFALVSGSYAGTLFRGSSYHSSKLRKGDMDHGQDQHEQQRDKQSWMDSGTVAQLEMSGIMAGIACLWRQLS